MRKTGLLLITAILMLSVLFVGCSSNDSASNDKAAEVNNDASNTASNTDTSTANTEKPEAPSLSKENPMIIDKDNKTITVYATVNGKYFTESTIHGLNFHEGKNAPKAMFVSYANMLDFHDALVELGAAPGNNLAMDSKGQTIEGQDVAISFSWDGANKAYGIDEVIIDSQGKPFAFKFGGNYDTSVEYNTGCMMCMESCPIGVTSNSSYVFGEGASEFKLNQEVLPADGTPVFVTFSVK